jgi:hypothetical protein
MQDIVLIHEPLNLGYEIIARLGFVKDDYISVHQMQASYYCFVQFPIHHPSHFRDFLDKCKQSFKTHCDAYT